MNRFINIIFILSSSILAASCVKEKLELTYTNQEKKIDSYIEKTIYTTRIEDDKTVPDTLEVVYNNGSNRIILEDGTGEKLSNHGFATIYYAGYIFQGNKSSAYLFTTNHHETATEAGWTLSEEQSQILRINMTDNDLIEGLRHGLTGVKSGEHCEIIFSGKYGFGKKSIGIVPANSALLYEIWVEAISND